MSTFLLQHPCTYSDVFCSVTSSYIFSFFLQKEDMLISFVLNQTNVQESSLVLTGPSRAVVAVDSRSSLWSN
jgi:hypothetical protein